jgi:N utilization substance protein B
VTTDARDLALAALYEMDQRGSVEAPPDLPPKAAGLVAGVLEHRQELDRAIDAVSEHWRLERMPVVDRAILRLGAFELQHRPRTPAAVVVSEAVRLAKEYSTERSGAFVNGVLATLAERSGRAAVEVEPAP